MLDIAKERKKIEKVSGFSGMGNRYNGVLSPIDMIHAPKGTYVNPDGTFTSQVSDPADQIFDTYNGVGYLHQQFPPIHVIVDGQSNATGECPCKQGKPCPCKQSKAVGDQDVEADVQNADLGVANILAANEASQSALMGSTTMYWIIGGIFVVGLGVGVYLYIKNKNTIKA